MCRCSNSDTINLNRKEIKQSNNPLNWRKLSCGLYINSNEEIGFPTRPNYVFKEYKLKGEDKMCPNKFITLLNDSIPLKTIIDTNTFRALGALFFRDKNSIFHYYAICDGGYLNLFSKDTAAFEVLNNSFVRHHSSIFHERSGIIDADINTFKVSKLISHIAKDKNSYFLFNERINRKKLKAELKEKLFNQIERELCD